MEPAACTQEQHEAKHFLALAKEFQDFAFTIFHDLNAPLRAVAGFSEVLDEQYRDVLDAEGRQYLSIIHKSAQRAQAMLAGLLEYARLNTLETPMGTVDCTALANDCLKVLGERIVSQKARVEYDTLPHVRADAEQLMRLFLILLENALTFHAADTPVHIRISALRQGELWQFCVEDNGIGIEPEFHDAVFQLFRRLHGEDVYPGIGMGLTMAKKIVERHGGAISIASEANNGARVYFTLPAAV